MSSLRREDLIRALPYARRYARALTGHQSVGDGLVAEALNEMLTDTSGAEPRQVLYGSVTRRFDMSAKPSIGASGLTQKQRQLLLLTSLEELTIEQAALLLEITVIDAAEQLRGARDHLCASAATDVLIIEDEPIIAMDIEELVQNCGHRVVGVAATEAEAVAIAAREKPGLILADINLGVGGDGSSAVARILRHHKAPVIFVTAYPERLLTGDSLEPAFVITKPFEPVTLAIATYQAVTGGVLLD